MKDKLIFQNDDLSGGYDKSVDAFAYLNRLTGFKNIVKESFSISNLVEPLITKKLEENGFIVLFRSIDHSKEDDEDVFKYINIEKKALITIYYDDNIVRMFYEQESDVIREIRTYFLAMKVRKKVGMISFLTHSAQGGFSLIEVPNKKIDIDIEANYETSYDLNKLISQLKEDRAGLILLSSHTPGTGKSYLIKHFSNIIEKKFVFLPNNVISNIANPDFMGFALRHLKNTILIAEDAELCLIDRQKMQNDAVSTLLNITDGIVGDAMNLKVIATLNNEEHIDRALLRKGRLIAKVDFSLLSVEKANKFLKNRGIDLKVTEPTSLANLYNIQEENTASNYVKRIVGFKQNN